MKAYVVAVYVNSKERRPQKFEEDEDIEVELLALDKVKEMVKDGTIKDMGFLSALNLLT